MLKLKIEKDMYKFCISILKMPPNALFKIEN